MEKPVIPARFSAVIKNRNFMFLWMGQLLSQLADRIFIYVLVIEAYNLTRTNLGVSVPMLSFGIPSVLFASFAGVYVDRWNKKTTMVASDLLRGAFILLVIFFLQGSLLWLFLVSFMIYTISQFFAPAEASCLAEIVEKENLIVANSFFMTTWMWSSVIGFAAGAPLVLLMGEKGTFGLASALYLISALSVFMVSLKVNGRKGSSTIKSVKQDLLMGFEFIRRNAVIRYSLIKMMIITCGLAVISMLAIEFAEKYIGIGARNFGYLVLLAGGGMLVGMLALGRLGHYFRKSTIVFSGFIVSGLTLTLLSQTRNLPLALALCFVLGFGNIIINATIQTILQHKTPRSLRGRVFGIQNMMINFAFTIPVVIFGAVADSFGLSCAILLLGLMILLSGLMTVAVPKFRTV
ncbi:MAG: MFS transporter [Candidatus Margulisiibacteriota bacterium]